MILRELLSALEVPEPAGKGWTEYTLHDTDLDQDVSYLVRMVEERLR